MITAEYLRGCLARGEVPVLPLQLHRDDRAAVAEVMREIMDRDTLTMGQAGARLGLRSTKTAQRLACDFGIRTKIAAFHAAYYGASEQRAESVAEANRTRMFRAGEVQREQWERIHAERAPLYAAIQADRQSGMSRADICSKHGLTIHQLERITKKLGPVQVQRAVDLSKCNATRAEKQAKAWEAEREDLAPKVQTLIAQGLSIKGIASVLHVRHGKIDRLLKAMGWKTNATSMQAQAREARKREVAWEKRQPRVLPRATERKPERLVPYDASKTAVPNRGTQAERDNIAEMKRRMWAAGRVHVRRMPGVTDEAEAQRLIAEALAAGRVTKCETRGGGVPTHSGWGFAR